MRATKIAQTNSPLDKDMKLAIGLKNPEPLVKEERVEKVFYQLQMVTTFPNDTTFTAYIQEPSDEEPRRLAVFLVTSEHPRDRLKKVYTFNPIEYETWREIEKSYRHYAGLSDPIRPIFAGTLRRHLEKVRNLKELTD
jgi:hypothetical protein